MAEQPRSRRSRRRVVAARRGPPILEAPPLQQPDPPRRSAVERRRAVGRRHGRGSACCRHTCALRSSSAASCSRKAPTPVSPSLRATSIPTCATASQSSSRTALVPAWASRTATSTRSRRSAAGAARVLAFDWLGQACSSRPPFPPPRPGSWRPTWLLSQEERIEGAINFYVESLEAWRAALGIETFDLIAHSIGGYFSAFYAMAYPGRVRRLVLHGAVGIGPAPPLEGTAAARALSRIVGARIPPFWPIEALWPARSQHGEGGLQGLHGHRVGGGGGAPSASTGGNCSARNR